jgi:hypothetical protein
MLKLNRKNMMNFSGENNRPSERNMSEKKKTS